MAELTQKQIEETYHKNFQKFIKGLEKLSKECGIAIRACGCFDYYDINGFKDIKYNSDSSSGDLNIEKVIYSNGEAAF